MASCYVKYDNVLLYLSAAAPYTVKAEKFVQHLYSIMAHVTCIAHAIRRLAEGIRTNFQGTKKLISSIKEMFLKASYGVYIFKTIISEIALTRVPLITLGKWQISKTIIRLKILKLS